MSIDFSIIVTDDLEVHIKSNNIIASLVQRFPFRSVVEEVNNSFKGILDQNICFKVIV
jgi:hypothetical protein